MGGAQPSGTVTLVFTDVEGSTKLLEELGTDAYREALGEHRRVVREAFDAHRGYEVDYEGDAFFYAFASAQAALSAVSEAMVGLEAGPIRIRVGIHTGEPALDPPKYVGMDVHRAARIMSAAHGGQVVLSPSTISLLEPGTFELIDLGEHRLKDIEGAVSIFQLGDGSFPPLKTISNTNLPRPASSFVGRESERDEILARIEGGARLVTLTGPGGTGKTRLALEAACSLVPEYKAGVFWVGLAALRDPALVTETIAQTLGAKDGLAEHIGEREMLLLIDNLEQVVEAAPELSSLLQGCRNLILLVTSRELLRVQGEIEYEVPPLQEPEAVSLFCERSQLEPSDEIAELCRRLDSLPLAVELAAARTKALSPKQILERFSQRLDLFKGGRDADPRQHTLRATIEWSYDLLSEEEQRLFRALSVFAGGCTLESAEEVADANVDTLQSLVEKSLLRFTNERYWMLETIREYASQLAERPSDPVSLKHAGYFLRLAEHFSEEYDILEADHDNMRAALGYFVDAATPDELRLVRALTDFWVVRGHLMEGAQHVVVALARHPESAPDLRVDVLFSAADFVRDLGDVDGATAYAAEALELARGLDDGSRIGRALHELGESAVAAEEYGRATELYEEAITVGRGAGKDAAGSLANLGFAALLQGDYGRAAALSEEALALFRQRRHTSGVCVALGNLAEAELGLGQQEEARIHLAECLELAREAQFLELIAGCLATATALLLETGNAQTAARLTGAEDALLEQINLSLPPAERRRRARLREDLRALLRTSAEELHDEGRRLTVDEASTLALEALSATAEDRPIRTSPSRPSPP
jgi:predicted ATPase/class 3 adenylate cyclase